MHRAGTSVVARALQALGIDLGSRLMSADVRMNARGFFEDLDIVRIDDALLEACGADWKNIALLDDVDWTATAFRLYADETQALLAARVGAGASYGCKDPRIARLLPFWQRQFVDAGVADHYVIAVRHPLSVIASLTSRDGLDARRSAWLWLTHFVCAMRYTAGRPRVVVDYDRMLEAPERELERIRVALALPRGPEAAVAVSSFTRDFLSPALRHAEHGASDLAAGDLAPAVSDAWALASALARDEVESADCQERVNDCVDQLRQLSPLLRYAGSVERAADQVSRLEGELAWARESLAESRRYVESLREARTGQEIAHATAAAYAVDLQSAVESKDAELTALKELLEQVRHRALGRMLLRGIARKT